MKNYICVYDFETDGAKPNVCQPVQLAACMLHPISLDIVDDSEFCSFMKPEGIEEEDYFEKTKDTINWHAGNYCDNYDELDLVGKEAEAQKIFATWNEAPNQEQVFKEFCEYLLKYNTNQSRRSKFTAPICAGANIRRFDNIIMQRLCTKYKQVSKDGEQKIFHPRDSVDIVELAFLWFHYLPEPKTYNMEELRNFFGMSNHGAHDALNDIRDEARIIQKFLKLHRHLGKKVQFKNAMK